MFIIYMYTLGGKAYIGQTSQTLYRRAGNLFIRYKSCPAFHSAVKKYGADAVKTEILYRCETLDEANRLEVLCITRYGTLAPNGYNLTTGGVNYTPSEETKRRISIAKKGHVQTPETRAKISKNNARYMLGKTPSQQTRAKIGAAHKGKTVSDVTRAKLSSAHKGKILSDEHRANIATAVQNQVHEGTHHFLGGEISRKSNRKRVAEGTHNWLGPEHNRKRLDAGTHNLLGKNNPVHQRIADGTHNFLNNPELHRKAQRRGAYAKRQKAKARRREHYRLYASLLFTKSLCEIYRTRKLTREGFFDKDVPDTSQADPQYLF